jgi:DNA-binding transcriptional MocR family regulator
MAHTNQPVIGLSAAGAQPSRHPSLPIELRDALDGWRLGEGPLSQRLAAALARAIGRQDILPGTGLPPERLLAAQLGVARTTVSAAYQVLHERGLVTRRQGRGTHVTGADGARAGARSAELVTSLQRNVLFRRLGESPADAVDLLASSAPPGPAVRAAVTAATAAVDADELMDGHGYQPLGYPPLRRAIAARLTARGLPTDEEEILVTGGGQQAISLLAACYLTPGAAVVLEDPTFPGAIDAFRAAGGRIVTVPAGGGSAGYPEALATAISQNPVRASYLMPTFHNPTGRVLPEPVRRDLARLARATGVPVIEDDTLAELALDGEPPPPLAVHAPDAQIASVGSLSKLYWAGLRIGWIRAPRPMIAQLGRLKAVADLGTSLVSQAIAVHLLASLADVRELRCRELGGRLAHLEELLRRLLPGWTWRRPGGGLSLWARLPGGSSAELAQVATRHGVLIAPGEVMSPTGGCGEFVRLPVDHAVQTLDEGITRLAAAWRAYQAALVTRDARRVDVIV